MAKRTALKRRSVTTKHLFRKLNDKPTMPELEMLQKAVYHSVKMTFDTDETGDSTVLFEGKPVKGKDGKIELMDLVKKIINTYGTI